MENTAKERFYYIINVLGLSDYWIYHNVEGITKNMLAKLRQGITEEVSTKILIPFCEKFPQVNANYILTNQGQPFFDENNEARKVIFNKVVEIPLVSQYAYAGYMGGYSDKVYMESLPSISFTPDREMTGNYVAFEVKGDSMDDGSNEAYQEGEILVCREVEKDFRNINEANRKLMEYVFGEGSY